MSNYLWTCPYLSFSACDISFSACDNFVFRMWQFIFRMRKMMWKMNCHNCTKPISACGKRCGKHRAENTQIPQCSVRKNSPPIAKSICSISWCWLWHHDVLNVWNFGRIVDLRGAKLISVQIKCLNKKSFWLN